MKMWAFPKKLFLNKCGAVLPVVVSVLLCASLMAMALIRMPGGVLRASKKLESKMQNIYDAESEILKFIHGLPETRVSASSVGPWLELSIDAGERNRLVVLAGRQNDSISRGQKREMVERFRLNLNREILMSRNIKIKSGNRRLMGAAKDSNLVVENGDLWVDLFGAARVCHFKSYASITVRGSAVFDTLRLYAVGPLILSGNIKVKWLEAYSADRIEVMGEVAFSGVLAANNQVLLRQHALARFPSSLLSLNASVNYEQKNVEGTLLLPVSEDEGHSELIPFSWNLK